MSFREYKLSKVLKGHDKDVRNLDTLNDNYIVSVGRDFKVLIWVKEDDNSWTRYLNYKSQAFINSVAILNDPNILNDETLETKHVIAAGSQDALISLTELEGCLKNNSFEEPKFILLGHEKNVCSISYLATEDLVISSSWDFTAIVWKQNVEKFKLVGHKAAVWDAKFISKDTFLTCSADLTIKLWKNEQNIKTFTNIHTDVIRALVVLSEDIFISASNDTSIKIVSIESGEVLKTLKGHNSFIYQIKLLNETTLISCGEDRCVKIWNITNGECLQTIFVPCISVWSAGCLSNGDIVVGGSDSVIRIFSNDSSRIDEALHSQLLVETEKQALNTSQMEGIDDTKTVSSDTLLRPGKRDGQVVMVKNASGIIEAHQWSNSQWNKIGEVLGGAGMTSSGQKVEYKGKKYDFVFDVDIGDNTIKKLPFNLTDNPFGAAENFLSEYELPYSYLNDVVNFINQNTQGVSLGQQKYIDPYGDRPNFTTFEIFKKPLIMKAVENYNNKVEDISKKFSQSELEEIGNLLNNVTFKKNAEKLYDYADKIITTSGDLVGYDLLRIIIKNLDYNDDVENHLNKALLIVEKPTIENADATRLIMVGRCVCNLLANNANNKKKFNKNVLSSSKLKEFFNAKIKPSNEIKESVKTKLKQTIEGLSDNLIYI